MTKWVMAVVLLVSLAGCGDKTDDNDSPEGGDGVDLGAPAGDQAKQSTGGGAGSEGNRKPLLTFSADVATGEGPLAVTFTILAADDDKDPLTWTLDADGDGANDAEGTVGSQSPKPTYTYRVKGTYTATATASDGKDTVEAAITITVTKSEPLQIVEATLIAPVEGCFVPAAYEQAGTVPLSGSGPNDVTRLEFAVDAETIGRPFAATWTFDTGYLSMAWFFTDGSGTVLASDFDENPNFGNYQQTGEVPEGAMYGVFYGCGGPAEASVRYEA